VSVDGETAVWTSAGRGTYQLRKIDTGRTEGGAIEILRGVSEADFIAFPGDAFPMLNAAIFPEANKTLDCSESFFGSQDE
jgi:hypothetical protein